MKVLVKNIRHLNESVFQGMFDKAFSSYAKKKQINESDPNPYSFNNTMRNNLATYLNYGVFVGSAISNDSNVVPVPTQDETRKRLPYPYVPIMGYGIKALEDTPGTSTTAIRKSGIGEDEELKDAFSKASSTHPEIIQPDDIIFGWQQKLDNKTREHKNGTSLSVDRQSSWGLVGEALAFQQICYLNDDGEISFSDNPSEVYPIYSTQKQHGTNVVYVKLEPLEKQSFLQAVGEEYNTIINSKIEHIVSTIRNQSGNFNENNNSDALMFFTDTPEPKTSKIDNDYKPIPPKMYRKVFSKVVQYIIKNTKDTQIKNLIKDEYSYILSTIKNNKPDRVSVNDLFNRIMSNADIFVSKMRTSTDNFVDVNYRRFFNKILLTEDEIETLGSRLTKELSDKKYQKSDIIKKYYKSAIRNIKDNISTEKHNKYATKLDANKIKNIFDIIYNYLNEMSKVQLSNLYTYIEENYVSNKSNANGSNDMDKEISREQIIADLYFDSGKKYYYWQEVSREEIGDRFDIIDRIISYVNVVGDTGAHKKNATVHKDGDTGFKNIDGDGFGEKLLNACIRAYVYPNTKSCTFITSRKSYSSLFGDKVTSKKGNYRAFIVFDDASDKITYDYSNAFNALENDMTFRYKLVSNINMMPKTLEAQRLTGKIYFLLRNPAVEDNDSESDNGKYHTIRSKQGAVTAIPKKSILLAPQNQTIGFSVLITKSSSDNYFFIADYGSEYFNIKYPEKTGEEVNVVYPNNYPFKYVSGSDKNHDKSASQINYGALGGTTWSHWGKVPEKSIDLDKNGEEYSTEKNNEEIKTDTKSSTSVIEIPNETSDENQAD